MNSEGTVVVPPTEEQAGDGAQPSATAWQGCIVVRDAVADGKVVTTMDGVASAEDCCRACKAANDTVCNAWNWCPVNQTQGCT